MLRLGLVSTDETGKDAFFRPVSTQIGFLGQGLAFQGGFDAPGSKKTAKLGSVFKLNDYIRPFHQKNIRHLTLFPVPWWCILNGHVVFPSRHRHTIGCSWKTTIQLAHFAKPHHLPRTWNYG